MGDDKTRAEFEELIKSSPFEHMCDRNGDNSAWPGHYKRYETQLAWDVWQAAKERYGQRGVPEILFDGYAVFKALSEEALECTTPKNVAFVLDAIVRILKEDATKEQKQ